MDGKKCHRKTPKNHSKPVKFLTVRINQVLEKCNLITSGIAIIHYLKIKSLIN